MLCDIVLYKIDHIYNYNYMQIDDIGQWMFLFWDFDFIFTLVYKHIK